MYFIRPNTLLRCLYPAATWRVQTKEKKIFLTFDDGPVPEVTPQVLSILRDYKIKATFFCVGENIEKHAEIFQNVILEGHSIGNHTYHHLNGWKTKTKEYLENVEKCKTAMYNGKSLMAKGYSPSTINHKLFFRPPYGRMKLSQYSILNTQYSVVLWDVLSGDFDKNTSEEKCLKNVIRKTRKGSIVVFHDSIRAKKNLLYALPGVIKHFSSKGFEFMALPHTLKL